MLSEEFKDSGPSFNCLALGAVQTEMLEEAFPGFNANACSRNGKLYFSYTNQCTDYRKHDSVCYLLTLVHESA